MPFDNLAPLPEMPSELDDKQGRRIRDILVGWSPRTIDAPRRWRPLAAMLAGIARLPLSDKGARPC